MVLFVLFYFSFWLVWTEIHRLWGIFIICVKEEGHYQCTRASAFLFQARLPLQAIWCWSSYDFILFVNAFYLIVWLIVTGIYVDESIIFSEVHRESEVKKLYTDSGIRWTYYLVIMIRLRNTLFYLFSFWKYILEGWSAGEFLLIKVRGLIEKAVLTAMH